MVNYCTESHENPKGLVITHYQILTLQTFVQSPDCSGLSCSTNFPTPWNAVKHAAFQSKKIFCCRLSTQTKTTPCSNQLLQPCCCSAPCQYSFLLTCLSTVCSTKFKEHGNCRLQQAVKPETLSTRAPSIAHSPLTPKSTFVSLLLMS